MGAGQRHRDPLQRHLWLGSGARPGPPPPLTPPPPLSATSNDSSSAPDGSLPQCMTFMLVMVVFATAVDKPGAGPAAPAAIGARASELPLCLSSRGAAPPSRSLAGFRSLPPPDPRVPSQEYNRPDRNSRVLHLKTSPMQCNCVGGRAHAARLRRGRGWPRLLPQRRHQGVRVRRGAQPSASAGAGHGARLGSTGWVGERGVRESAQGAPRSLALSPWSGTPDSVLVCVCVAVAPALPLALARMGRWQVFGCGWSNARMDVYILGEYFGAVLAALVRFLPLLASLSPRASCSVALSLSV